MVNNDILAPAGIAFFSSVCLIPLAKHIAWSLNIVAKPAADRWAARPVPLLGGAAIIGAFAFSTLLSGNLPWWLPSCLGLMFLLGVVDDLINLEPRVKLGLQVLIVVLTTIYGPNLTLFDRILLNKLATIGWLLVLVNAFNLLDHLDGLSSGIGIVSGTGMGVLALLHSQFDLACWSFALAGALGGFLIFNWNPASIFMGDAGSLPTGLLLGILSTLASQSTRGGWLSKSAVAVFLVLVPLLDTSIVTITRIANGHPISHGGRDHSSHRLVRLGLSERSAAVILYVVALASSGWALFFALAPSYYAVMLSPLALLLFTLLGICLMNLSFDSTPPSDVYPTVPWFGQMILSFGYKRRIFEMGLDSLLVAAAYYGAVLLRDNYQDITPLSVSLITARFPLLLTATYVAFFSCRIYHSMWQNVGIEDIPRFAAAATCTTAGASVLLYIHPSGVPQSTVILFGLLLFNLLAFSRLSLRLFRSAINKLVRRLEHRILIIGTGGNAELALRQLAQIPSDHAGLLVGFVDRDPFKLNKLIHGHRIIGSPMDLESLYSQNHFNLIVIADDLLSHEDFDHIFNFAQSHDVELRRYAVQEDTLARPRPSSGDATAPQPAS